MKMHTEEVPVDKIKEILHEDPEFVAIRAELEAIKKQKEIL